MARIYSTQLIFKDGVLNFIGNGFKTSINMDRVELLNIDEEAKALSAEEDLTMAKVHLIYPDAKDHLRMVLGIDGTTFRFTVHKDQGTPVASHAAAVLNSIFKDKLGDRGDAAPYPIHINSCGGFPAPV